jgi:cell wall-associated NlpC family hydrolase
LRSRAQTSRWQGRALAVAAAITLCAITFAPSPASAASGGTATPGSDVPSGSKAKLSHGEAIAPAGAPARVQRAITFANRIRKKPYKWGGGHGSWKDKGYDCSGAVSYALHGARMLDSPMPSGPLSHWGQKGKGEWITVYANGGHAYAVIAGLRWDTSGGPGPRWHTDLRSNGGFKKRHFKNY